MLERTDHQLCMPELMAAKLAAAAPNTAARRAFSLAFSITQRDVVSSAEPDADRKPCAVWLA
jgi:hypothetical protein